MIKNLQVKAKIMRGPLEVQKYSNTGAGDLVQPAKCLLSKHEDLSSILSPDIKQLGVVGESP